MVPPHARQIRVFPQAVIAYRSSSVCEHGGAFVEISVCLGCVAVRHCIKVDAMTFGHAAETTHNFNLCATMCPWARRSACNDRLRKYSGLPPRAGAPLANGGARCNKEPQSVKRCGPSRPSESQHCSSSEPLGRSRPCSQIVAEAILRHLVPQGVRVSCFRLP